MRTLRTRFGGDIVAEFLPPRRKSEKVVILCGGMPGAPSKGALVDFFSKKGYWTFYPRYRGSWESGGKFLRISPHKDVLDVIDQLPQGFKDLWSGKTHKVRARKIYLLGGSFGGPAAILASRDPRVTKTAVISPVVDWRVESKVEPLDWFGGFVRDAFGEGYRFTDRDWKKLKTGTFYNPVGHLRELDPDKIFVIHARDDEVVPFRSVTGFVRSLGCSSIFLKRGGHLSLSLVAKPRFYKAITKFLRS